MTTEEIERAELLEIAKVQAKEIKDKLDKANKDPKITTLKDLKEYFKASNTLHIDMIDIFYNDVIVTIRIEDNKFIIVDRIEAYFSAVNVDSSEYTTFELSEVFENVNN